MAKITTYDSATAKAIAQFVRDQKRQAPRRLNNDLSMTRNPRVIRWAKATTNARYPTYPTSGTVFVAQLGDYEISDTATVEPNQDIDREFTEFGTSEADYVIALCAEGASLPAENDIVRVELHDGQWVLLPAAGNSPFAATFYYSGGTQWITSGGSATNVILPNTTCSAKFNRVIYANWTGSSSDTVITSKAATQTAYSDAAFRVYTPGAWYADINCEYSASGDWLEGSGANFTSATTTPSGETYQYDNGYRADSVFELSIWQRINAGAWVQSARCVFNETLAYNVNGYISPIRTAATVGPIQLGSYSTSDTLELQIRGTLDPNGSYPTTESLVAFTAITFRLMGSSNYAQSF